MKILIFHPVLLPPKDYGGIERVVLWLSKALRDHGHQVSVAALRGSQLPEGVELVPVEKSNKSASHFFKNNRKYYDVVHFMATPEDDINKTIESPWLVTIHGNGKANEHFADNTLFLSKNHAQRHGRMSYVYNGIDVSEYCFLEQPKSDTMLFLSKTSWRVKNVKAAIKIAKLSSKKLTIAGGWRPFNEWFNCLFYNIDWIGPINGDLKMRILSESAVFLFPVLWDEPFGLAVVEALASGLPVYASDKGSMPEIITDDVGRLLNPERLDEWVDALADFKKYDRKACRDRVVNHFSHHHMANEYLNYYKKAVAGEKWL